MSVPAERFQVDNFYWQVYKSKIGLDYTALAKVVPFVHFGEPMNEPSNHDVWFEFGTTAEDAYARLRASLGLAMLRADDEAGSLL